VVINGGREPPHWEQYPGHQFLHTIGAIDCCGTGGCWKSRVVALGDGDHKDRDLCPHPIAGHPRCMRLITPDDVISAIEKYEGTLECGDLSPLSLVAERPSVGNALSRRAGIPPAADATLLPLPSDPQAGAPGRGEGGLPTEPDGLRDASRGQSDGVGRPLCDLPESQAPSPESLSEPQPLTPNPQPLMRILIDFRHGLGDAVQLTTVLLHLRHYHPEWQIDVAAGIGKLPEAGHRSFYM
jgi:hypothetical protein